MTENLVESLREIKDDGEIAEIREAMRIAERAFARDSRTRFGPGEPRRKSPTSWNIRFACSAARAGRFRRSSASVRGRPCRTAGRSRTRKIGDYDFVLIDWGARGRLYHSDLTRVLVTGKLSPATSKRCMELCSPPSGPPSRRSAPARS